jgi:hypothetical protein
MLKQCLSLAAAAIVVGCGWGCSGGGSLVTAVCPKAGEGEVLRRTISASGGKLRQATPPDLFAKADGQSVKLSDGAWEWCGLVADVFPPRVTTADTLLVVTRGKTIQIGNPLPNDQPFDWGIGLEPVRIEPTTEPGHLLAWPSGVGGGGSAAKPEDEIHFDDGGISFRAGRVPGRYLVTVGINNAARRTNTAVMPRRTASYTLLLEVTE